MQTTYLNDQLRSNPINRIFIINHTGGVYACLAKSAAAAVKTYHAHTGNAGLVKLLSIEER